MTGIEYYNKGDKFLSKYNDTSCEDYLHLALSNYNKAIELQPENTEAIYKRSIVYGHLEEYEDKLADLASVIRLLNIKINDNKDKPELHYNIALAFRDNYDENDYLEKARYHFEEALRLGYNTSDIYFEIAENYCNFPNVKPETALNYYSKAIEIAPDISEYYLARGECYSLLKRLDFALADFNRGIELNTNDWRLYNRRGELFLELHEWDKATTDYIQFRRLYPRDVTAKIELLKNMDGGCLFEFYFAENLSKHKHWHTDSYFLEDCIFTAFYEVFKATKQSFNYYGDNEYSYEELKNVLSELNTLINKLCTIKDYQSFFHYMISCKFIYTLIRDFDNYEARWIDILRDLREVTNQLINLVSKAISKNQKLFLFGI